MKEITLKSLASEKEMSGRSKLAEAIKNRPIPQTELSANEDWSSRRKMTISAEMSECSARTVVRPRPYPTFHCWDSKCSCIFKTFERMLKERLTYWLESSHKLSSSQAGFRTHRSTEHRLPPTVRLRKGLRGRSGSLEQQSRNAACSPRTP